MINVINIWSSKSLNNSQELMRFMHPCMWAEQLADWILENSVQRKHPLLFLETYCYSAVFLTCDSGGTGKQGADCRLNFSALRTTIGALFIILWQITPKFTGHCVASKALGGLTDYVSCSRYDKLIYILSGVNK